MRRDGKVHGVLILTDARALDMLERHIDIRPVGGDAALIATLEAGAI
jgi:hypothetical protein